jgi:hypothetical protein
MQILSVRYIKIKKENLQKKIRNNEFKFNKIESIDYKIYYLLASKSSSYELIVVESDDLIYGDQQENYNIKNFDTKINLNFNLAKGKIYQLSTNKQILGKLINDLEKCYEAIKKFKLNKW